MITPDLEGRVHGCILVFRDISERKAAEREINEAQARLQRVVTDMAIPTMVFADDGEVVLVNAAWTGISGFDAGELRTVPAWTRKAYGEGAEAMDAAIARLPTPAPAARACPRAGASTTRAAGADRAASRAAATRAAGRRAATRGRSHAARRRP